jgi:hypothetical protein
MGRAKISSKVGGVKSKVKKVVTKPFLTTNKKGVGGGMLGEAARALKDIRRRQKAMEKLP